MKRKIISMFLIITVLIAFCSFSNGAENAQLDLNQQKEEVDNKLEEANDQLEYIQGELTNTVIEIQKLDGVFIKAGNVRKNNKNPNSVDCLLIQRHILGLQNLEQ